MEMVSSISAQDESHKKLVIGWFSFTCSEDSTILLTELLNDHLDEWKKFVDFRYLKALKTNNLLKDLDVAFVEGAISSEKQAGELARIRKNTKYLVAIGACACTGMPSSSRNAFSPEKINDKIKSYLTHFHYSDRVKKLEDIVKVDDKVEGCPMNTQAFVTLLNKYLQLFGIIKNA